MKICDNCESEHEAEPVHFVSEHSGERLDVAADLCKACWCKMRDGMDAIFAELLNPSS